MSVVVAIKEKGKIYLGSDSQVTQGGTRISLKNPNNYKIWKVKSAENCLMASVGMLRDACLVRTMDRLVTDYNVYRNHIDFEFVVDKIIPDIIERFQNYGILKSDEAIHFIDSEFLFAYQDQLYLIGRDLSVIEIDDCVAIGSGASEAIGSLLSTEGARPEERIVKAIKASAANDIYVDYPIVTTDTQTCEFTVITEKNEKEYLNRIKNNDKKGN